MNTTTTNLATYTSPSGFEILRGGRAQYDSLDIRDQWFSGHICSFVVEGSVETDAGIAVSGDLMIHPACSKFFEKSSSHGIHEWIEFTDPLWPGLRSGLIVRPSPTNEFHALTVALSGSTSPVTIASAFYGLLNCYVSCIPLEHRSPPGRFDFVLKFLQESFSEPIRRDRIASLASMNPNAFDRAFLREYGVSPMYVLRQIRLDHAKKLLVCGEETLDAIAFKCGLPNGAYLSRVFKLTNGVTPTIWRQRVNKTRSSYYETSS